MAGKDITLTVGVNGTQVYSELTQKINSAVERINAHPKNILVQWDQSSIAKMESQINELLSKMSAVSSGTTTGVSPINNLAADAKNAATEMHNLGDATDDMGTKTNAALGGMRRMMTEYSNASRAAHRILEENVDAKNMASYEPLIKNLDYVDNELLKANGNFEKFSASMEEAGEVGTKAITGLKTNIANISQELDIVGKRSTASLSDIVNMRDRLQGMLDSNEHLRGMPEYTAVQEEVNRLTAVEQQCIGTTENLDSALAGIGRTGANAFEPTTAVVSDFNNLLSKTGKGMDAYINSIRDYATKMQNTLNSAVNAHPELQNTEAYRNANQEIQNLQMLANAGAGSIEEFNAKLADLGRTGAHVLDPAVNAMSKFNSEVASASKFNTDSFLNSFTATYRQMGELLNKSGAMFGTEQYSNLLSTYNQFGAILEKCGGDASRLGAALNDAGMNGSSAINQAKLQMTELKVATDQAAVAPDRLAAQYQEAFERGADALARYSDASKSTNAEVRTAYTNLSDSYNAMQNMNTAYMNGAPVAKEYQQSINNFNKTLGESTQVFETAGTSAGSFGTRLFAMAKNMAAYMGFYRVFMMVIRAIRELITSSIELDSAMAKLQIVTKASSSDMENFGAKIAQTAKEAHTAINDIIDSTTTYARLGYNADESSILAKFTAMLKEVGDIDTSAAQDAVTSIIKAWKIEDVNEVESIMDKLVKVGNNFPISVAEIATGMTNASSTLAAANNSFEKSVALLTAANTTMQDAAKASTGLRTITARLRNTKAELDDLGEVVTTPKYEAVVEMLTRHQVHLREVTGEYRDTYDVMKDIASVWDEFTDGEQATLATELSGTRMQAVFYSIINNFQEAEAAMDAMNDSAGELGDSFAIYADTAQAHINDFKTAFKELGATTFASDFIKDIVDMGTALMNGAKFIGELINKIGGLKTVLYGVATVVAMIKADSIVGFLTRIPMMISSVGSTLSGLAAQIAFVNMYGKDSMNVFQRLSYIIRGAGGSMSAASLGVGAFMAALGALILIINKVKQAEQERRQASKQAYSDASSARQEAAEAQKLYDAYIKAKYEYDNQIGSKKALEDATYALAKALGVEGDAAKQTAEWLKMLTEVELANAMNDAISARAKAEEVLSRDITGRDVSSYKDVTLSGFLSNSSTGAFFVPEKSKVLLAAALQEVAPDVANNWINESEANKADALIKAYEKLKEMRAEYNNDTESWQYKALDAAVRKYKDDVDGLVDAKKLEKETTDAYNKAVGNTTEEEALAAKEAEASAETRKRNIEAILKSFEEINGAEKDAGGDGTEVEETSEKLEALRGQLDDLSDRQIQIALDIVSEGSVDSIDDLIEQTKKVEALSDMDAKLTPIDVRGYKQAIQELRGVRKEAEAIGVDFQKTVYGNIDTNNRQVLTWTDDTIKQFKSEIESWGVAADELKGQFFTVFGGYGEYDGIDIAFSPILQTENGPQLLSSDTVDKYIWGLIDEAGEGWTNEQLLELDAEGLEIDGQKIKGLIADIGETAAATSEQMHFTGKNGALSEATKDLQALADKYGVTIDDIIEHFTKLTVSAEGVKGKLSSVFASEDFDDINKSLTEIIETEGKLTGDNIMDVVKKSDQLSAVLKMNGMDADYLANILQTQVTGGDWLSLVTDDALALNQALFGGVKAFEELSMARERYASLGKVEEKDEAFKDMAGAFKTLNEEFEKGTVNSNAFWNAAEFLFGKEQLDAWGWSDGLDQIYESMRKNKTIFEDADSAGIGFLERLHKIAEDGQVLDSEGNVLAQIEKLSDGSYDWSIDNLRLDELAEKMGISSEAITACVKALDMFSDVDFSNMDEVMNVLDNIDNATASVGEKTAVSVGVLEEQLRTAGKNAKDINYVKEALSALDNVTLVDITGDADSLVASLTELGIAKEDAGKITIDSEGFAVLASDIGATKDEATDALNAIAALDGVSFNTPVEGANKVDDALKSLEGKTFAETQAGLEDVGDKSEDTSDNVEDVGEKATEAADAAEAAAGRMVAGFERVLSSVSDAIGGVVTLGEKLAALDGTTVTTYVKQETLPDQENAKGTKNAKPGTSLVGELGEELWVHDGSAYLTGTDGPEIVTLSKGDIVYTAEETKDILKKRDRKLDGISSFLEGWSGTTKIDKYKSLLNNTGSSSNKSSGGGSSSSYSSSSSSYSSDSGDDEESWFERQYKYHQHMLKMDAEMTADYLDWLIGAYQQAYNEGIIELDDFYKYEEEVYDGLHNLFKDYLSDQEHRIDMLDEIKDSDQILSMYAEMIEAVEEELTRAIEQGLDDSNDYFQELESKWKTYSDNIADVLENKFKEYLKDTEHAMSMWANNNGTKRKILSTYKQLIVAVERELKAAYKRGLTDADDYVQELLDKIVEYKDAVLDMETEVRDSTKDGVENIISMTVNMLKQNISDEKDAISKRLDNLKEFYDKQKELLQDAYDEEKYLDEQTEKRKAVSDIQMQIDRLALDNSAWAQKKRLELMEELADAQKELDDFEKEHALKVAQEQLDESYEMQQKALNKETEALEEREKSAAQLREEALDMLRNNGLELFNALVEWNNIYGDGIEETIVQAWKEAYTAMQEYFDLYNRYYNDIVLPNIFGDINNDGAVTAEDARLAMRAAVGLETLNESQRLRGDVDGDGIITAADARQIILMATGHRGTKWGYAGGTSSAKRGLHRIDELGDETIFTSRDGSKYKMFSGGEKVLNAKASNFLYEFANNGAEFIKKIVSGVIGTGIGSIIESKSGPAQINMGDIIIEGNADKATVSEIRRAQRDQVDMILRSFKKLKA